MNQKPTSRRRQEASRRNGALSHGPVTPEGKARSSRNAVTHGCLAQILTFTPEEREHFDRMHQCYIARFEPRDQVELDLVEEITWAKWQMRQAWIYETTAIQLRMEQDAREVDSEWKTLAHYDRRVLAILSSAADGNAIPNFQRYARTLALQADRSIKSLMELQKQPIPPPVDDAPGEPEPAERNEPLLSKLRFWRRRTGRPKRAKTLVRCSRSLRRTELNQTGDLRR